MGKGGPATTMPLLVRHAGALCSADRQTECLQQRGSQRLLGPPAVWCGASGELNLADDVWCTRERTVLQATQLAAIVACVDMVGGRACSGAKDKSSTWDASKQAINQDYQSALAKHSVPCPPREAVMGCTIWIGSCRSCILRGWEILCFVIASISCHVVVVFVVVITRSSLFSELDAYTL